MDKPAQRVAVIGAGWAGCAAAVAAKRAGHQVTLYEASHHAGGRARKLEGSQLVSDDLHALDNGQHVLIGAYTETLSLMRSIGVDVTSSFVRTPLQLQDVKGQGLRLPNASWAPPALVVAWGVMCNAQWTLRERLALMRVATSWQLRGFTCPPEQTVSQLCAKLPAAVMRHMIEPLCVSALNTPAQRASASVFLRVLHDALFAVRGGSDLLIPRTHLSALLPEPALAWLRMQGADLRLRERVTAIAQFGQGWQVLGHEAATFDALILALPHKGTAQLIRGLNSAHAHNWLAQVDALTDEAIATVYVQAHTGNGWATLPQPMLRLDGEPAQFVFDRGQLGNGEGVFALVASAPDARWPDNAALTQAALTQAQHALAALGITSLTHLQTVVEKRATFACTPDLIKPAMEVSPQLSKLLVCGDYVQGPYPATLEAAVHSGLLAAHSL